MPLLRVTVAAARRVGRARRVAIILDECGCCNGTEIEVRIVGVDDFR